MKKSKIIIGGVIVFLFAVVVYLYPRFKFLYEASNHTPQELYKIKKQEYQESQK